ncbi:hypothetical protein BGZ59_008622 [Podila verticillata]|nr:hypothetical protein BGZ59_008622 [Podila verticillata]
MVDPVMVRSSVNGSSQPPLQPRPQQQPPQQPPRRIKTSLTTLGASQNSRLVRHLIGTQDSPDSNTDGSVVQIHVRYVPKDLWVKIDLPRDIPVHKARDMILSKCRLTSLPPVDASQPPLPPQETSSQAMNGHLDDFSVDSRMDFKYELDRVLGQHSQLSLDVNDLMTVSRNSATMHDIDEDDSNDDSSDDDEAELRAEALMANDDLFEASPTSSRRHRTISLQGDIPVMPGHRRSNSMTLVTKVSDDKQETSSLKGESRHTVEFATNVKHCNSNALNQQQLKRLLSYSSLHSKGSGSGSTDSRDSGSYSTKRFSNIPGWSHYRNRQQSQNGIQLQREVLEHGGVLADRIDCDSEDQMSSSGTMSSDCVAWKACFGLFWVAAGHWLDDSRMINSYQLQPNCLLELQLRNNYIQLPPPGGQLNYYDHYAEGILYKMSKKSGAVSKLTSHGSGSASKDSTGVWKERWVVLQGTKLFLYHKRKDTTKKVIQLVNTGQSTKSRGSEPSKIPGNKDSNDKQLKHSSSNSALGWFGGLTNTNESNSHYRTSSQASTLVGSGAYLNQLSSPIRESIQNQQNIAASTESFWQQQQRLHQEHDRRMKTITDPTPFVSASPLAAAKFKLLSPFYNHPKESRISLKQCLDKSAKSPLDSSNSSRSSLTTLYSGYVWLYVPNIPEASALDNTTGVNGTKSNISISKASGRYVKCFAAINDKGQFQWVEVKKTQGEGQEEGGRVTTAAAYMNKTGRRSSSRPSYAIQLSSSPCPSATSGTVIAPEQFSAGHGEAIEVITEPEATVSSQGGGDTGSRIVQASMAHKLRLYFFCIKISPASLAEVMSELSAASSDAPSLKPTPNKEAAMSRAQSTPKTRSPLAGIVLPPRTTSLPSARAANESAAVASTVANDAPVAVPISTPRFRSETEPAKPYSLQNSQKFPTWPSMSPLHSDKSRNSRMMRMSRTVSSTSISSTTSTACAPVQESSSKTPGMISFERERTMSAPPGSYRASQLCRPGFATLGRHDSICSTRSMLQHTTYIRSNSVLTASPAVMASHRALTGGAKLANKEGPIRTLPNSSSAPSLTTCAAASASSPPPALDPELKSNVLTLAQDLQKVMLSQHSSISSKSSGEQGDRPVSVQSTASLCLSRPKLSLSETMAVKRASLQESTASTFRSLQHKPSLGNISDVVEECEQEDKAEEQKQRQVLKLMCPFLEQSEHVDAQGRTYVTLKGYTETEEGWKSLQSALERFIDGPINDQRSALPPVDTLIPSYNSPPVPEMRQSERAQNFWNAKAKLSEAAYVASLLVSSPATAPSTTGNVPGRSESVQGFSSLGHSTKILASGLGHRASLQTGGRTRPMTSASMLACPPPLFQRAS